MLNNHDYISKDKGKFKVHREINNEDINFGVYDSLEEAIKARNILDDDGWPVKVVEKPNLIDKYIEKKDDNTFYVFKNLKNIKKTFGPYDSLKKAKIAKYNLISNGWESDLYHAESKYGKYIKKEGSYYIITKFIKNKHHIFGKFSTLDEAIEERDELIADNWGEFNLKPSSIYGKYIHKVGNYYRIDKWVNGKNTTFGFFTNLKDAIKHRDILIKNNWEGVEPKVTKNRYIHQHNYGFTIYKRIDGNLICFGYYPTFEKATEARDELIKNNWEESEIKPHHDEETQNYIKVVDGYFLIERTLNNETRVYGVFKNKDLAIKKRDKLLKNDWNSLYAIKTSRYEFGENIVPFDYVFNIEKKINGDIEDFGTYYTFEDAVEARNELINTNWGEFNSRITFQDIKKIYNSIWLEDEPKVPFPQVDVFDTLIKICNELKDHCLKRYEIKEKFNLQGRQYSFYISAGLYLNLVVKKKGNICLSNKGKKIFSLGDKEMNLKLVKSILEHKPYYDVFSKYLENSSIPSVEEIFLILKSNKIYNVTSDVTLKRRSLSVRSWIKWIVKLYE